MDSIEMPREMGEKWLAALRSGKYLQCRGQLSKGGSFCCLGVLNETACLNVPFDEGNLFETLDWDGPLSTDQEEKLIAMNDAEHKSFSEIADYIEANMEYIDD